MASDALVQKSGTFSFVTEGIESALHRAREAAGEKHVRLMGADIVQQFLRPGSSTRSRSTWCPLLLGEGTRLFDNLGPNRIELDIIRVIESPEATHLKFQIAPYGIPTQMLGISAADNRSDRLQKDGIRQCARLFKR